jgi:transmembrane sensor
MHVIDNDRLDRLLLLHLSGEATATDQLELDRAMADEPALRAELERLRVAWRALGERPPSERATRAWIRFQRHSRAPVEAVQRPLLIAPPRKAWPSRVVAFVAGLAAAVAFWLLRPSDVSRAVTYSTAAGERASVDLGDGTRIMLAPSSRVRVTGGMRSVDLDGEASFDVTHDGRHPFAVRAGHVVVRDIGTRFIVRAYASDTAVRVVVASGRVVLHSTVTPATEYVLGPGDGASVVPSGRTAVARGIGGAGETPWDGRLNFRDTPLPDVASGLSWWFGIDVEVGDPVLAHRSVTGSIALDETAQQALESVALVARARVVERDHAFVFMPNPRER